jgi:hypothetical protein
MAGPGCTPLFVYVCSKDNENNDVQVPLKEVKFGDFLTYRAYSVMLLMVDSAMAVSASRV